MSFPPYVLFFGLCAGLIVFALAVARHHFVTFKTPPPVTFVDKPHPVLGTYREFDDGHWWARITSERLGYELTLSCKVAGPTEAQLERWSEMEARLPALLKQTPQPPDDDGWGNKPGPFDASMLHASLVIIAADDSFSVLTHVPHSGDYMLSPIMDVTPDWRPSFEWQP